MGLPFNRPPNWVIGAAVAGAAAGAAVAGQAITLRRWAQRPSDLEPDDFSFAQAVEHRLTSHDGASIYAVEAGVGPTVVLGHGIAGDHTHWVPVAAQLVRHGSRVVVFDQRGHGQSGVGSDGFSITGLAHDVATVVTELGGPGPVVLAGHSMGGVGVQALCRHHPEVFERISRVVIVASLPHSIHGSIAKVISKPFVLKAFRAVMANQARARLAMRGGFGRDFSVTMLDHLAATWATTPDATLLGFGTGLSDFSLLDDLRHCPVPATVICGTADAITPLNLSVEIARAHPDSTLIEVAEAGHMIIWEAVDLLITSVTPTS